jgi:hypothetical protein
MRNLVGGLAATCAIGACLMPEIATGCLLVGLVQVAALILYRKEVCGG